MGLVTKALVHCLMEEGLVAKSVKWEGRTLLGDWLKEQGIALDAPIITQYFGVPYQMLEKTTRVRVVGLPEAFASWKLYQLPREDYYVCTRPPTEQEKNFFCETYGNKALYLTDAVTIQSIVLEGLLPPSAGVHEERVRYFTLEEFTQQGRGHIDGVIACIIEDAIHAEATDIHLCKMRDAFEVVFRVAGRFTTYATLRADIGDVLINKLKLMAEMDIAEHRLPQDGHIEWRMRGAVYHLRLGTLPLLNGEKIVIRLLPEQQRLTQFRELGFSDAQIVLLKQMIEKRQGLFLITGPTNSGKTTTLYACLQALAQSGALVYTIEDPVEVVLPQIQQMQVNNRSGFNFAAGLRGILRSDPDVIAVGELRDRETVDIAARAALSGHLVIATLHAYDAHQTINRLRDLGLSDLLISAVLLAVVNQRLLSRACSACNGKGTTIEGKCCECCMGSGQVGRIGIQEIWSPTAEERANIEIGLSSYALREKAIEQGFVSLDERLAMQKQKRLIHASEVGIL